MSNARSAINQIIDDIVNDAQKDLENVVEYVAKQVRNDWSRMAQFVMDRYYDDYKYTTRRYKRTFSMYNNVITPILERDADGYTAGVEFDWSRMNHGDGITDTGEFWILNNFLYGYHGNENYTVPGTGQKIKRNIYQTTPSANTVLDRYYENYDKFLDRHFDYAVKHFVYNK